MTLEARKFRLIKLITGLDNELIIEKLEELLDQLDDEDKLLFRLSKPIKDRLDIEQLIKEQNFKHPTKEELDSIMEEAAIEEPIEDLLKMI